MRRLATGLLAAAGLAGCAPAPLGPEALAGGAPTGCRVGRVIDGDSVAIVCDGDEGETRVRLAGFDAPEIFRPRCAAEADRGFAAKAALERMLAEAEEISVGLVGKGRRRPLVRIAVDGRDVADRMIAAGLARPSHRTGGADWCADPG